MVQLAGDDRLVGRGHAPSQRRSPTRAAWTIRRPVVLVLVGTAALVAIHLWLTSGVSGPTIVPDETGHLGNARWLSGDPHHIVMPQAPYYGVGYPLLLAPLHWLVDDPGRLFQSVLTMNALSMAMLLPLTYAFCRRVLEAAAPVSLIAAASGSLVPAAVSGTAFGFAENLVLPLCVLATLAFWLFVTDHTPWQRLLLGPVVALLFATHSRFLVVLVVAVAAIAAAAITRLAPWRVALANVGLLAALVLVNHQVRRAVVADRWVNGIATPEGSIGDAVHVLTHPSLLYHFIVEASGQAWYLAAGSLGLAVFGVALVVGRLRPPVVVDPRRLTLLFLLTSGLAVFAVSTLFFTRLQFRADHLVYGRHNESFMPIWIAAGVVFLLSRRPARTTVVTGMAAIGLLLGSVACLTFGQDADRFGSLSSSLNVPALHSPIDFPGGLVSELTIGAVVAVTALTVAAATVRTRWRAVVVVAAVAWYVAAGVSVLDVTDRFSALQYEGWQVPGQVAALGVTRADIDANKGASLPALAYQWYLPEVRFHQYRPDQTRRSGSPYVFAPLDDAGLHRRGARVALTDEGGMLALIGRPDVQRGFALWVLPGPQQDRLARDGKLLPAGFPARIPVPALRVELRPARPAADNPVVVSPGTTASLVVQGRHVGKGSPWPDLASFGLPGRVRIRARLTPMTAPATDAIPVAGYGELSRWVWPGDTFTATVTLTALDDQLRPLTPGRYRVDLDVVQEGYTDTTRAGQGTLQLVAVVSS